MENLTLFGAVENDDTRVVNFQGGPLDSQRHRVPAHVPAFIRIRVDDDTYHWYCWKVKTKATYTYLGTASRNFVTGS